MPIIREHELEDGSKRIYHSRRVGGKTYRRIYFEDRDGSVKQVVYGDNQKSFPVVLKEISHIK